MMPDMDDIDVLQRELDGRSYPQEARNFVDMFDGRTNP
jgi:hypothetical protein